MDATLGLGHYGYRSPEPYAALGERERHEGYMSDMEKSGHWNVRLQLDTAWMQAPNIIAMSFAHEGMHQLIYHVIILAALEETVLLGCCFLG